MLAFPPLSTILLPCAMPLPCALLYPSPLLLPRDGLLLCTARLLLLDCWARCWLLLLRLLGPLLLLLLLGLLRPAAVGLLAAAVGPAAAVAVAEAVGPAAVAVVAAAAERAARAAPAVGPAVVRVPAVAAVAPEGAAVVRLVAQLAPAYPAAFQACPAFRSAVLLRVRRDCVPRSRNRAAALAARTNCIIVASVKVAIGVCTQTTSPSYWRIRATIKVRSSCGCALPRKA